jgi:hypothetical protein
MKELYGLTKARRKELCGEIPLESSLTLQLSLELDLVSVVLKNFALTLDAQSREHYLKCSQLYSSFATEYDHYVVEQYEAFNLSDERLLHKLRKA